MTQEIKIEATLPPGVEGLRHMLEHLERHAAAKLRQSGSAATRPSTASVIAAQRALLLAQEPIVREMVRLQSLSGGIRVTVTKD